MNTSSIPVVGILDRLSTGVSRTSIRHYAAPKFKKKKHNLTGFKPGHGERIFVYNHIENGMIIYSHDPELKRDSKKHLSQIPFTVKKQKPALLRTDYWQPLCMIQFDAGQGVVGRNVFQKLREFRSLHELQWGWQAKEFQKLDKRARGERIHNQKPNAVADIAAVLAGAGRGNLMWTLEPEPVPVEEVAALEASKEEPPEAIEARPTQGVVDSAQAPAVTASGTPETKTETSDAEVVLTTTPSAPAQADETAMVKAPKTGEKAAKSAQPPRRLLKATIYWSNDLDFGWARKWSENVIHELGLPDGVKVWNWKTKMIRDEYDDPKNKASEVESKAEEAKEAEEVEEAEGTVPKQKFEPEQKKGWFGWLGGKTGGSSQDARA